MSPPDPAEATSRRTRRLSILLLGGVVIYVLGTFWDARWHDRNPDALESGTALLEAHGGYWLALLVVAGVATWGVIFDRDSPNGWSYGLVLSGALVASVAMAWDAYAHSGGDDSEVAHVAELVGILVTLTGVIFRVSSVRSLRPE